LLIQLAELERKNNELNCEIENYDEFGVWVVWERQDFIRNICFWKPVGKLEDRKETEG
jgi:hypothetical protein